ncbi:MAG: PQQ-dependent sugar dehydrogenase [Bryobacterales bacterium]|nr:PQQ-dependent sugar dehydrogenase [Bryobacterales bacterium]
MRTTVLLSLVLCLPVFSAAPGKRFSLPAPDPAANVANPPKVIARPDGTKLRVPPGFHAEQYAEGFKKPRYLLELPDGHVLVSDAVTDGGIYVVTNGQPGKALITGLERPFGMAYREGWLYVAEVDSVKRYPLDLKTLTAGRGQEIVPLKGYTAGHWTRALAFDRAGRLYVSVGSASNVDAGGPEDRAAILAVNADGSDRRIIATGLRNPVGIRFHPQSGRLWATVQERDGLGEDLVPDYFTEVQPGGFYGWPYAYIGSNEEPRRKGENPEAVSHTMEPDVLLPPHAAVMDFIFYTGRKLPKKYQNGAFLAYRGSSNRAKRIGYGIGFVPFKNGKPAGEPEMFLSGFMLGEDVKEVWGRPVGLLQLRDGSLLFTEDANNKIWRIRYEQ